jgi:hypothetical protein
MRGIGMWDSSSISTLFSGFSSSRSSNAASSFIANMDMTTYSGIRSGSYFKLLKSYYGNNLNSKEIFTMRETILGNHIRKVPSVAVGCMRLSEKSKDEMNHFIHAALEQGAYFFDHADIYGGGMSESVFGEAIADDPSIKREDIYLQSKCGFIENK